MQEGIEALIDCVVHRVGIVPGKPVAALTIYKCLLNWKSFESEKTCIFNRLLQMMESASKVPFVLVQGCQKCQNAN